MQSYFHREIYTYCYVLAAFWPFVYGLKFWTQHIGLVAVWYVSCGIMSAFTLLPAIKVENASTMYVGLLPLRWSLLTIYSTYGGLLMFGAGLVYLVFEEAITHRSESGKHVNVSAGARTIMGAQVGLILLSIIVTRSSIASLQAKAGLPLGNQVVGWFVLSK